MLAVLLAVVVAAAAGARVAGRVLLALAFALPFALVIALINPLVVRDGLTVIARLGTVPVLGQLDVTAEATAYGGVLALRALVVIGCFALHSAAVDPDDLLRAFRRVSFRSALTAALATRLVPVLARDARRLHDAQRCLAGEPAPRRADRARRGARARWTARSTSPRRSRCAATAPRGAPPRGGGRARGRATTSRSPRARVALGAARDRRVVGDVAGASTPTRRSARPSAPAQLALCARARAVRAAAVRRPPGDRAMSAALRLERVTYRYPGAPAPALRDVDLAVEPGEFVVLAGGSGSGKSTLLRAASGLVPHFHGGEFAGRLESGGLDTRTHEPAALAAVAGTLFQDPETQVVMGTVRAELAFPLENRGLGAAAVARGVEEAALALGIAPLLDRSTHELSGGELQRVALGAALAGRPRLALLDEPTSQLDPVAGDELLGVLRRLNEEWGTAVILAEHRLERCLSAADRVVALRDGAIACDADPRGFLDWAGEHAPELQTPGARLFALAGRRPLPVSVKDGAPRARGRRAAIAVGAARAPRPVPDDGADRAARRRGASRGAARARAEPALALVVGLVRAQGRRGRAARRRPRGRARRARRADGPQRRRQVDAAARRRRAARADAREGARRARRAAAAEPRRLRAARPRRRRAARRRARRRRARRRSPTATRATSPAASASGSRSRSCCTASARRSSASTSRRAAWTARHKDALAALLGGLAAAGSAVIVATHDAEFAAAFAARTVLLGDGRPVADAPTAEVLAGGWYFATQTARILGGAALLPGGRGRAAAAARAEPVPCAREGWR